MSEGFLMMIFMAMAMLGGILIGSTYQHGQGRERFLTYCTAKGDTYEACKEWWSSGK